MTDAARQVERVARLSYGRLAASLTFRIGDISAAEDAFSEALLRALEVWPKTGVPDNPEGWLLRTARNNAIDQSRVLGRAENLHDGDTDADGKLGGSRHRSPAEDDVRLRPPCHRPAIARAFDASNRAWP